MFCLNDTMRYHLCPGRTDMRKGINSLIGVVKEQMGSDVRNGDVFIFIGGSRRLMKLLHAEDGGMVMYVKHITEAKVHDSKAMHEIPYEKGAHYIFDCGYNDFNNLYTVNRIEAFFVVRAKTNVRFKPETWKRRLPKNVVSDATGYFTVYKSAKDYPEKLRKVVCIDPEDGTRYIFLTNNLTASAETIAELYRNRRSVELFFKWIKQHLRIKKFWGTSENAVRIQIYCAIITYCLVAIVQHDMRLERSIYEVLQILGISLTDKTNLRDLFDKSNFKKINVLCDSSEPNLFNF